MEVFDTIHLKAGRSLAHACVGDMFQKRSHAPLDIIPGERSKIHARERIVGH
jgi:hypothetical protein